MSADILEDASRREYEDTNKSIMLAREAASKIEKGQPGECIECGEYFTRTVRGMCGRCRDTVNR